MWTATDCRIVGVVLSAITQHGAITQQGAFIAMTWFLKSL